MQPRRWTLGLALLAGLPAAAQVPAAPPASAAPAGASVIASRPASALSGPACFDDHIRISALISAGGKVKVGIVETGTQNSYLVSPGESAGDVLVVSADYEREQVVLRRGNDMCTLNLASDPNAVQSALNLAPPVDPIFRGEAIEKFLRENPNAMKEGAIKFPLPEMPPAVGKGEAIEAFLRLHPELAAKANQPAVGRGEGIEAYLKAHPEIKVNDAPIPEGSLGPGIEAAMKANPLILTNPIPGLPPQPVPPPVRR